jgi:hypothetical protein
MKALNSFKLGRFLPGCRDVLVTAQIVFIFSAARSLNVAVIVF